MLRSVAFRVRPSVVRMLAALALVVMGHMAAAQTVAGRVTVRPEKGFGRIVFTFPEPVGMTVRVTGGVLILGFDRPVALSADFLSAKLPDYIAASRMDPDNRSLRFALVQSLRADLKDAAEDMYLDLLPATWRGTPPPLPPDVAAELARRARAVRETIAEAARERAKPPVPALQVATADSDTRKRIVFALPTGVSASMEKDGLNGRIVFDGEVTIDPALVRSVLSPLVSELDVQGKEIAFRAPDAVSIESDLEQGAFIVDLLKPKARAAVDLPPAPVAAPPTPMPDVITAPPRELAVMRVSAKVDATGARLDVSPQMPLAVFERGSALWLVARGTKAALEPRIDAKPSDLLALLDSQQNDGWTLMRFSLARPGLAAVTATGEGWTITVGPEASQAGEPVRFQRFAGTDGKRRLVAAVPDAGEPLLVEDPDTGDMLHVVSMSSPVRMLPQRQRFAEFDILRTAHGLAMLPQAEDVAFATGLDRVSIQRPSGLAVSEDVVDVTGARGPTDGLINAGQWNADRNGSVRETGLGLLRAAAEAPRRTRTPARLRLAEFYLANGFAEDASGVLGAITRDDNVAGGGRDIALLTGIAAAQKGQFDLAARAFAHPGLTLEPEGVLWRAFADTRTGKFGTALAGFRQTTAVLDRAPEALQALLRPAVIEAALAGGDTYFAGQQLGEIERMDGIFRDPARVALLAAKIAEASGAGQEALASYRIAASTTDRRVEAEARLGIVNTRLALGDIANDAAQAELETIAMIWRRGEVEVRARAQLSELMVRAGAWRDAFSQVRRAVEVLPDHVLTKAMQAEASRKFASLFMEGKADRLDRVQALAIFDEYRWLIPPGTDGDDIVTRLAERLYDLDLIDQASELLDHQINHRLKGTARAKVATRLALMQLVNGKPQQALTALRATRLATLPDEVKRGRLLIEARALGDLSRGDLALEVLASETGPDVERLRADIHWRAKRWREAAETYERGLGSRWRDQAPLSDGERADVLRAGIGYVLSGDKLGSDRLRTKFLPQMAETADGGAFKLVTLDHLSRPDAFRDLARRTVSADSIGAFLESYRKRYPDSGGAPKS